MLLDENLPHDLRYLLAPAHEAFTVAYMRWSAKKNGTLLRLAGAEGFDVLITADRGYEHQQNLNELPCSVILVRPASLDEADVFPLVPKLLYTLDSLQPKSFVRI